MEVNAKILKEAKEEQERMRLLSIFPHEIWFQVFEEVNDPDNLVSMTHSSSFWRELLMPKREQFLFPQVLNILTEQKLIRFSDFPDLLQLRLVCKMWKRGLDRVLGTRSHHSNLQFFYYQHYAVSDISYPVHFRLYKSHVISKLKSEILPIIDTSHGPNNNPFPSRHLELQEQELIIQHADEGQAKALLLQYRETTEAFLKAAGHHFWYAHIDAGLFLSTLEWYLLITKYVQLMPNLRSLYIRYPASTWCQSIPLTDAPAFPIIENLEVLSIGNAPKSVMNIISQACRNIHVLIIPRVCIPMEFVAPADDPTDILDLSSIISPDTISIDFSSINDFSYLPSHWKSEAFRLRFSSQCVPWSVIFHKLEEYKDTVKDLYLQLPPAINPNQRRDNWESSTRKLDLPNVKILNIQLVNHCSLDFLLGLTSLDALTLHFKYCETAPPVAGTSEQLINFKFSTAFPDRFMECNIWALIPSLKTVRLKTTSGREIKYRRGNPQSCLLTKCIISRV